MTGSRKSSAKGRTEAGAVLVEMFGVFLVLGLVTAVAIPQLSFLVRERRLHTCAERLDRLAADPGARARCPATGADLVHSGQPERSCCPNPRQHGVDSLCTGGGAPLASRHPPPSPLRWLGWGLAAALSGGILAFVFVGNIVTALRSPRRTGHRDA